MTRPRECSALEIRYCEHFVLHGNQTDAFIYAYATNSRRVAQQKVGEVHRREHIQRKILELQSRVSTVTKFDLTAADLKKILMTVVQKSVRDKKDLHGNTVPCNPAAAVAAVAELNRMNGNHAPAKSEITGANGGPLVVRSLNDFYTDNGKS